MRVGIGSTTTWGLQDWSFSNISRSEFNIAALSLVGRLSRYQRNAKVNCVEHHWLPKHLESERMSKMKRSEAAAPSLYGAVRNPGPQNLAGVSGCGRDMVRGELWPKKKKSKQNEDAIGELGLCSEYREILPLLQRQG